jgi:hypothetical protein
LRAEDPAIAELLKLLGYATGKFGKNHLGDKNPYLPTVHGFDEFFGNLYHLNAKEEPELPRELSWRRSLRALWMDGLFDPDSGVAFADAAAPRVGEVVDET